MPNYIRVYEKNYYIFATVITYKRNKILIENIEKLRNSFKQAKSKYLFEIFGMVVLPDHFHIIFKPEIANEYSKIIGSIKSSFTKTIEDKSIDKNISISRIKRREKGVWQRRFYEHTIRNEEELYGYLDYIHYNPVKHGCVKNVKAWEFSSFHKFVRKDWYDINWGSLEDIKNIDKIGDLIYDNVYLLDGAQGAPSNK